MTKKAYIFDMDGTLIDSVYSLDRSVKTSLDTQNIKYPENIVEIITPLGYEGAAKYLQSLGVKLTVEEIMQSMKESMIYDYQHTIPLKEHVKELLERLYKDGNTLCVLTASPHFLTDPCLERLCVWDKFAHVFSTDDFGMTKSDVRIYGEVAKRIGFDITDCVFVDDNLINITTAKQSGIGTVAVYDIANASNTDALKQIADRYVHSFDEF